METVYNMTQIREYWESYRKAKAWRVLRDGKWKLYLKSPATTDATRCEMVKIREHMSFPKYLERFHA